MNKPCGNSCFVCFRRWSRKAYAIFSSLKICVVIGHLGNKVADCSLSKLGKSGYYQYASAPFFGGKRDDDMYPTDSQEGRMFSFLAENPFSLRAIPLGTAGDTTLCAESDCISILFERSYKRQDYEVYSRLSCFSIYIFYTKLCYND